MSLTRQMTLDLGYRPAYGAEDFLVAPNNADAVAWIDRWPDWPGGVLVLWGPQASGKSHLVQVWRGRAGAEIVAGGALDEDWLARRASALPKAIAIEEADRHVAGRPLLHLYNLVREAGSHLLITAREPPARWPLSIADLASRLRAVPAAEIGSPDDALLAALVAKHFRDRQITVEPEVVAYLVRRMERSCAAARTVASELDRAALSAGRPITVPLAREVMGREPGRG